MDTNQQRIAIAEHVGYKRIRVVPIVIGGEEWAQTIMGELAGNDDYLPNYPYDLNAMHEAEKVLTGEQTAIYCEMLCACSDAPKWCWHVAAQATAAARAEAFVRTIGKWIMHPAPGCAPTSDGEGEDSRQQLT